MISSETMRPEPGPAAPVPEVIFCVPAVVDLLDGKVDDIACSPMKILFLNFAGDVSVQG
jgi:hypothetical protein